MTDFQSYLDQTGEIGYVDEVVHSVVRVAGLPQVAAEEIVMFESDEVGQVMSLTGEYVEVLPLSEGGVRVGDRVTRTKQTLKIEVGEGVLGKTLTPLGRAKDGGRLRGKLEMRGVNALPPGLERRKLVNRPLTTGVSLVDLVVPLGRGQRELVMGDRKMGKSTLLLQTMISQAKEGAVCIYALIGKKTDDGRRLEQFLEREQIRNQVVIVASSSSDPAGLVFITPYTAMTVAEYFRDQGRDVVVILDDLSTHAKFYRQITLLSRRFPGRNSYPGDIFYIHAKLLERAGQLDKGSISCLPVAETIFGDLSGYIQTNLMAMTDGHIFFDAALANLGRRPSINPFLSVTRVGRQAQTPLVREVSRELSRFLTTQDKLRQFLHFGAELTERVKRVLNLGDRVYGFFELTTWEVMPLALSVWLLATLWAGLWDEVEVGEMRQRMAGLRLRVETEAGFKKQVEGMIAENQTFNGLVAEVKQRPDLIQKEEARNV